MSALTPILNNLIGYGVRAEPRVSREVALQPCLSGNGRFDLGRYLVPSAN